MPRTYRDVGTQEDFCQATQTPSALKYEHDGGPGMRKILNMLLGSSVAAQDRRTFFSAQILYWILAAIDGHAKNFSIALEPRGGFRLTPLYDVLSAYPVVGRGRNRVPTQDLRMAMATWGKNRHYRWDQILRRHWQETAKACGLGEDVDTILADFVARAPGVITLIENEVPEGFPAAVLDPILRGIKTSIARLG